MRLHGSERRPVSSLTVDPDADTPRRAHIARGATMLDEEVVLVDIFTPIREDLLTT
jgi:hypothetical protein